MSILPVCVHSFRSVEIMNDLALASSLPTAVQWYSTMSRNDLLWNLKFALDSVHRSNRQTFGLSFNSIMSVERHAYVCCEQHAPADVDINFPLNSI